MGHWKITWKNRTHWKWVNLKTVYDCFEYADFYNTCKREAGFLVQTMVNDASYSNKYSYPESLLWPLYSQLLPSFFRKHAHINTCG